MGKINRRGQGVALEEAWTPQCESSFNELKERLGSAPVLAYANFKLFFILKVDASHDGQGTVLSQEQDGKIRPIAYGSRSLHPAELQLDETCVFGHEVGNDTKVP